MSIESRQFNFMLWMTVAVVLTLIGAATYAFISGMISWKEYAATMVPIATGFGGYWWGTRQ